LQSKLRYIAQRVEIPCFDIRLRILQNTEGKASVAQLVPHLGSNLLCVLPTTVRISVALCSQKGKCLIYLQEPLLSGIIKLRMLTSKNIRSLPLYNIF